MVDHPTVHIYVYTHSAGKPEIIYPTILSGECLGRRCKMHICVINATS